MDQETKCKCGEPRMHPFTLLCEGCYQEQNKRLKSRVRDVETHNEDRTTFLVRRSRELGLNYTRKQIRAFIRQGYTDNLILKTESWGVWTLGSEPSRALPYTNNNEVRF